MTTSPQVFRTRLCDLLAIDYPVLQSGMGLIAGPDLVAEVSNAGALGIVAGFMLGGDQLRAAIREVRARTNRPFGVNLWLASELRTVGATAAPADDSIQAVQEALNPIRETLGLPPSPPARRRRRTWCLPRCRSFWRSACRYSALSWAAQIQTSSPNAIDGTSR